MVGASVKFEHHAAQAANVDRDGRQIAGSGIIKLCD